MQPQYANLIAARDTTIRVLAVVAAALAGLALLMGLGWMQSPRNLTVHIPPDLSRGAQMGVGVVPKPNVYLFALHAFQGMNHWSVDGETDYKASIEALRTYLTPDCYADRLADYAARQRRGELAGRTRSASQLPGRDYSDARVVVESASSWLVMLDMRIAEHYLGEIVKRRTIAFPIRVTRAPIDPASNVFGLAIDCFYAPPREIPIEETL